MLVELGPSPNTTSSIFSRWLVDTASDAQRSLTRIRRIRSSDHVLGCNYFKGLFLALRFQPAWNFGISPLPSNDGFFSANARAEGFAEAAPEVLEAIRLDRRGVYHGDSGLVRHIGKVGSIGSEYPQLQFVPSIFLHLAPYNVNIVGTWCYTCSIWVRIRFGWLQGGRVVKWPLVWNCEMRTF